MDEMTKSMMLTLVFVITLFVLPSQGRIFSLDLKNEERREVPLSTFGFLKKGTLAVNMTVFAVTSPEKFDYKDAMFGFTLDKSGSKGISSYMEDNQGKCILQSLPAEEYTDTVSMIFFTMNFKTLHMTLLRRGKGIKTLQITDDVDFINSRLNRPVMSKPKVLLGDEQMVGRNKAKREANIPKPSTTTLGTAHPLKSSDEEVKPTSSDKTGDAKTASSDKPGDGKPSSDKPGDGKPSDKPGDGKPSSDKPGDGKPSDKPGDGKPSDKPGVKKPASSDKPGDGKPSSDKSGDGKPSSDKPGDGKPSSDKPGDGKPSSSDKTGGVKPSSSDKPGDGKPSPSDKPGVRKPASLDKSGNNSAKTEDSSMQKTIKMYKTEDGQYSAFFAVAINTDEEEGLYNLYFHNCYNYPKEMTEVHLMLGITEANDKNFLSAGEMPIPKLFFGLFVLYVLTAIVWSTILKRGSDVYKIHYLMLSVIMVKSLSCLFRSINSHFISVEGFHREAWAVLYYIVYLTKGALLFTTILLIGAGWAFVKHILSVKEKKLFLIILPLQVLDNVAFIIVEESQEGQSEYTMWKEVFIIIDLLCCGAILFPVVWSIRHLQQSARTDGKAAISLQKLKLFRQFYIMVVCYIYFTRIIAYLIKITVPFQYEWLYDLFRETTSFLFFLVTGWKFRPASNNPYLQVPQDSDDELEMDEVVTESAALDTVKRVNQKEESSTQPKQRESSHEYD